MEMFAALLKSWGLVVRQEAAVRREFSVRSELAVAEVPVGREEQREELKPKVAARVEQCLVEQAFLAGPALLERLATQELPAALAELPARWLAWRSLRIAER
jgi:hypothetical protein